MLAEGFLFKHHFEMTWQEGILYPFSKIMIEMNYDAALTRMTVFHSEESLPSKIK